MDRVPAGKAGAAAALRWLCAFRRLAQQGDRTESQSPVLSPAVCMLLTALLLHGDPAVQLGAVQTASAVAVGRPLMGIVFLPLLIYLLQRPSTHGDLLLDLGKCSLRICMLVSVYGAPRDEGCCCQTAQDSTPLNKRHQICCKSVWCSSTGVTAGGSPAARHPERHPWPRNPQRLHPLCCAIPQAALRRGCVPLSQQTKPDICLWMRNCMTGVHTCSRTR